MHPDLWQPSGLDDPQGPHQTLLPPRTEDDGSFELDKYLGILRQRWPLVAVCLLIAVSYALIQYSLTTKEFRASATIQIERKRLSLLTLGQGGWLEDWWNMEYYPTQYLLLRSRGMAERVVKNLRLYDNPAFTGRPVSLIPRREGTVAKEQTSNAELATLASRVQAGLTVAPIKDTQLVKLSYVSTNPELAAQIANGYAEAFIEWGVETRNTTVGQASSYLSRQIETLRQEIEDRQKLLNTVISEGDFALDPAGEALLARRLALEQQYNSVVVTRLGREAAYQEILSLPKETVANTGSGGRVGELKSELFTLESDYESKLSTYTPEWPEMKRIKKAVEEKRDQLQRLIDESFKEARDRAYAEYQKAKREEENLEDELQKLAVDARLQNSAALDYTNQSTYINTRKELLIELVKRQSETEVASRVQSSQDSNVRVVDGAIVPSTAFRPSLQRNLFQAFLFGIGLGLGGVFLLEFVDRTIKSPEELESVGGLPTLAVIPDIHEKTSRAGLRYRYAKYGYGYGYGTGSRSSPGASGLVSKLRGKKSGDMDRGSKDIEIELLPHHSPKLGICEAYRSLRSALLLSSAKELKVIAVTSAQPGEGKTATVSNLGVVLAQLDRRVLIIDADLRRPRMHKVMKVSNRLGLVNYLTSRVDVDSMILDTIVPNLFLLPSGPLPPNPSELLASDRLPELLGAVRTRFDFVLIDTPPVIPVADTEVLGTHTDGILLCARAGTLLREEAKLCRDRLRYPGLRMIGTILNRYSTSQGRYDRRYQQYYGAYEEPSSLSRADSAA